MQPRADLLVTPYIADFNRIHILSFTKRLVRGCENAAGKLRQKRQATAETKFTKPRTSLIVNLCRYFIRKGIVAESRNDISKT